MRKPSASVREITAGGGGAPAVVTCTGRSSGCAASSAPSITSTAGAPFRCVTPSAAISRQTTGGSTFGKQTCRPPTAVTAHVKHHPLQWNIGSVQRNTDRESSREWCASASALRYAPRYVYITPF